MNEAVVIPEADYLARYQDPELPYQLWLVNNHHSSHRTIDLAFEYGNRELPGHLFVITKNGKQVGMNCIAKVTKIENKE